MSHNVKLSLTLSTPYKFQLTSGGTKIITIFGSDGSSLDIEVDGTRSSYNDLQSAIGESFTHVQPAQ
ncbi:hypothetical protein HDC36_003781 [Xanthomonas sp. JAI131]|uniref:hypothetical protein n=1 Tax=Xanthomonas sp. JAI131 TaxID=2723067 RepID=UPI0015C85887|nr:hypothetical protein [Xanthomonas sp. JAI131]NYF22305.1 hypothetical protein [Xanthomonas sp. JAI131]